MPKIERNTEIVNRAENLLAELAKTKKVGKRPEKLTLPIQQQNKAELLKALDEMEKSRQLNESKAIMGVLDSIFKDDIYKIALILFKNNRIGYSCRNLVVFDKQQQNERVSAGTSNTDFETWIKNYFFKQIWKCFQEFEFYINSILQKNHLYGTGFKIYDFEKITWSPIKTNELELIIFEFFETNKDFKMIETLFRLICKRLNDFILLFNNKNGLTPDHEFKIWNFILNANELKLIDNLTLYVKQQIMMFFPEYRELYEKYIQPQEAGKKWLKKIKCKSKND